MEGHAEEVTFSKSGESDLYRLLALCLVIHPSVNETKREEITQREFLVLLSFSDVEGL